MSRIQNLAFGNRQQPNSTSKPTGIDARVQSSFGKLPTEDLSKTIDSFEKASVGFIGRSAKKLADNDSEIQTQLINGVFTGTLAPTMIAFNPFSKSDEKTKKYSALRQPISAVIAVAGGVLLTKPVNDYIEKLISEGNVKALDQRMSPMKSYIMPQFKRDLANAPDKKAFWTSLKPKDFNEEMFKKNGEPTKAFKKECIENYIKKTQNKHKEIFVNLLTQDPNNIELVEGTTKLRLKDSGKIIGENIPNLTKQSELTKYLEENNFYKMKFGKFLNKTLKLEIYDDNTLKPANLNYKLKSVSAMEFVKEIGFLGGEITFDDLELLEKVLRSQQKELSSEYVKASNGVIPNVETAERMLAVNGKQANVTGQMIVGESTSSNSFMTMNQLLHRFDYVDDADKTGIKKFEGLLQKTVKEALDELRSENVLGAIKTKVNGGEKKVSEMDFQSIGKNLIDNMAKRGESNAKNFVKYAGIVANVGIVMITCSILNWVYPRFVEAFFPHLSKSTPPPSDSVAKQGGNK